MNARNQLLVVLTALMVVSSGGAMVAAATAGDTVEQSDNVSEDEYDETDTESADESVAEGEDSTDTATELQDNESDGEITPDNESDGEVEPDNESDGQQAAHVTFTDQTVENDTVVVENATLASGGFVTIHDSSLLVGNVFESVIGTSAYLEAGTHENIEITLDEPLEEDETLIAMPHRDTNDNETYDFVETEGQADVPYLTADDEPVTDDAEVTIDGDDEDSVEEETGDEESVDNETEEEPVDDNETSELPVEEEPVDNETEEEPVDNETDEEPVDDNETSELPVEEEPVDNETEEEPVDNETDEEPVDEEPVAEDPMDQIPIDADERPVFVMVEDLTVEDLNVENASVYVLVSEDVDIEELPDEIDNITEEPITEEPVDDNETDEETFDNETDDTDEETFDDETDDTDEETFDDDTDDTDEEEFDNETDEEEFDNETDEEEFDNETDDTEEEVTAGSFNVSDLEAPESAAVGETITVTATIENPTDEERTETVQFRLDGDLVVEQNVTLEGDESDDIGFEVDTSNLQAGSYIHMVLTDQFGEVAILELVEETDTDTDDIENETDDDTDDDLNDTNETEEEVTA